MALPAAAPHAAAYTGGSAAAPLQAFCRWMVFGLPGNASCAGAAKVASAGRFIPAHALAHAMSLYECPCRRVSQHLSLLPPPQAVGRGDSRRCHRPGAPLGGRAAQHGRQRQRRRQHGCCIWRRRWRRRWHQRCLLSGLLWHQRHCSFQHHQHVYHCRQLCAGPERRIGNHALLQAGGSASSDGGGISASGGTSDSRGDRGRGGRRTPAGPPAAVAAAGPVAAAGAAAGE